MEELIATYIASDPSQAVVEIERIVNELTLK
jgi:hypothetical protein